MKKVNCQRKSIDKENWLTRELIGEESHSCNWKVDNENAAQ